MKLESMLKQKGIVLQSPQPREILARAQSKKEPTKIFYGETYDSYGNTLDSMKYYFFVSGLAKSLSQECLKTDPIILVADTAACRNISPDLERKYLALGERRADFIERVNDTYLTGLRVIKMSDYVDSPEFMKERARIIEICRADPRLMSKIEKTVPESKLEIEREKGFLYSFDEISSIIGLDVKVGPPREDLYDGIAREIARQEGREGPMSLFLTPTFPLGKGWDYFFANEGIEEHGITAYKAGSKRLQDSRIIVERTNPETVKELLEHSFISTNPQLPNPVLDVGLIAELARTSLERDDAPIQLYDDFYSGKIGKKELVSKVFDSLNKYILSKF